jgi:hypothetical protein
MRTTGAGLAALTLTAATLLGSCADAPSDAYVIQNDPGHVEHVDGSELGTVTLDEGAAERLQLETTQVTKDGELLSVPDTAVFVDPDGAWWVFTSPEPNVYVRHEISLDHQADGRSLLTSGPEVGTDVVTVGVAELYGIEAEVGH